MESDIQVPSDYGRAEEDAFTAGWRAGYDRGLDRGRKERITGEYRTMSDVARELGISRSLASQRAASHDIGIMVGQTNGGATRVFSPEDFERMATIVASYRRSKS